MDRNGPLRQALAEEALDLALLWQTEDQGSGLGLCPLAWIAHPDLDIRALLVSGEPLPLVMFDSPCLMRSRAIACLDAAGIPWQVVFVSHSLSGIWAAVQAGLGLTIRTRIGMPGNLRPQEDSCQRQEVWPSACDKPRVRNTIPPPWRCSAN